MRDVRYIRIDGRPLLLVYRPKSIPHLNETLDVWRRCLISAGVGNPYIVMCRSFCFDDPAEHGMDAAVEFPPHGGGWGAPNIAGSLVKLDPEFHGVVRDYRAMADAMLATAANDSVIFRGVCPSWDNTARRPLNGSVFVGSSPTQYGSWLARACDKTLKERHGDERIIFINAWNEWGEGAYLEPDRHYGCAYLVETRRVLESLIDRSGTAQANEIAEYRGDVMEMPRDWAGD